VEDLPTVYEHVVAGGARDGRVRLVVPATDRAALSSLARKALEELGPHEWFYVAPPAPSGEARLTNRNGDVECPNDGQYVNVRCWACGWVRPQPEATSGEAAAG
jgi:hypothetical protein